MSASILVWRLAHLAWSLALISLLCGRFVSQPGPLIAAGGSPPPVAAPPGSSTPDFSYCAVTAGGECVMWEPTVVQLLARPELYHGKAVRTIGFLHLEFEGNGLFISETHAEHVFGSGIWVDLPDSLQFKESAVHDRYVIIEGRYFGGPGGHFGMSKGRLDSIVRLDAWPSRTEFGRHSASTRPN